MCSFFHIENHSLIFFCIKNEKKIAFNNNDHEACFPKKFIIKNNYLV